MWLSNREGFVNPMLTLQEVRCIGDMVSHGTTAIQIIELLKQTRSHIACGSLSRVYPTRRRWWHRCSEEIREIARSKCWRGRYLDLDPAGVLVEIPTMFRSLNNAGSQCKLSWLHRYDICSNDPLLMVSQFWGITLAPDWLKKQLYQANHRYEHVVVPSGYSNYREICFAFFCWRFIL